ncbi:hypothetical protein NIES2100_64100 [Calothrix sp. NIES-2100]|nr:hypothetical protein NIES2100_64100 [Calothrix sp. NIES-2100]
MHNLLGELEVEVTVPEAILLQTEEVISILSSPATDSTAPNPD